jgi:hypothetical protein
VGDRVGEGVKTANVMVNYSNDLSIFIECLSRSLDCVLFEKEPMVATFSRLFRKLTIYLFNTSLGKTSDLNFLKIGLLFGRLPCDDNTPAIKHNRAIIGKKCVRSITQSNSRFHIGTIESKPY